MYDFMEYCLRRYYRASGWNEDNQYSQLCATSRALLDFQAPQGLSLRLSKLPSSVFKTTSTINALPILEGSIGYLFTSRPLIIDDSSSVRFRHMVDRLRIICLDHGIREAEQWTDQGLDGRKNKDYLLYGRMNLANARLEALYSRRISKHTQYVISGLSDPASKASSHLTVQVQYDKSKYCTEVSFSTDDGLVGIRGLYNFGSDFNESYHRMQHDTTKATVDALKASGQDVTELEKQVETLSGVVKDLEDEHARMKVADRVVKDGTGDDDDEGGNLLPLGPKTRGYWSAGAEVYYSATEKLGGVSTGLRYRTLPPEPTHYPTSTAPEQHQNYIPITITQTLNPIMGHVSSSYAAQVRPDLGLCSRFDFNIYSRDSELTTGVEWWLRESPSEPTSTETTRIPSSDSDNDNNNSTRTVSAPSSITSTTQAQGQVVGVIKARLGVQSGLAVMWEGRFNKLLFSLGFVGNIFIPNMPTVRSVGLEIQYFS